MTKLLKFEKWQPRTGIKHICVFVQLITLEQDTIRYLTSFPTTKRINLESEGFQRLVLLSVLTMELKERFTRLLKNTHIPERQDSDYNKAIRQRHAAILGICALVDSYPYTVEKWMPDLLTNVLAEHTYDPVSNPSSSLWH